ncbi:LCP family protein [Patescibacteria group bacterium]|nr:LCP family protein [Patescibacteria group bacterium]MBU1890785.1 LCP family protein [Patescibacteria group bacterium]
MAFQQNTFSEDKKTGIPKLLRITVLVILLIIVILGALFAWIYFSAPSRLNILVVGSDQRGTEQARSDVLMVFSIPKSPNQPLSLITIPRDTKVEVPGYGIQKITHAYALGEREEDSVLGSVDLTKETVEDFLDIPIHGSVEFTFDSFQELVDQLGGVDIDGDHLDGEDALSIVRNRYREGGDFARTQDQREVFLELGKKITTPSKAKELYSFFQTHDQTRLKYQKVPAYAFGLATYIRRMGQIDLTNTYTDFIPGQGDYIYTPEYNANLYYWVPDKDATEEIVDKYLH